jgi:hypothetical protein
VVQTFIMIASQPLPGSTPGRTLQESFQSFVSLLVILVMLGLMVVLVLLAIAAGRHRRRLRARKPRRGRRIKAAWSEAGRRMETPAPDQVIEPDEGKA